jgi:putative inorganic carbon (HCO3(-)) transporter
MLQTVRFKIFSRGFSAPILGIGVIAYYAFTLLLYLLFSKTYSYILFILPVLLLVLYWFWTDYTKVFLILCIFTPLAVGLKELGLLESLDLSIPTEPLMAGLLLAHFFNFQSTVVPKAFYKHPVLWFIIVQWLWMVLTSFTGTMLMVSLKQCISRLWFINAAMVLGLWIFQHPKFIFQFIYFYTAGLVIVIVYTLITHAQFNFNDKAADWVVSPFYNDHTAYGAVLAMFIPVFFCLSLMSDISFLKRIAYCTVLLFLLIALVLSFARAGWLSIVVALVTALLLWLKISFRSIAFTVITSIIVFFMFQTEILLLLGKNSTDAEGGFSNNVESVSNISTDASNRERINRWHCAIRMWQEKPFLGWGPGTYMFQYAPFQRSDQLTIISTNFGDNGNAHSEYLGPLAEQGWPGLCIMGVGMLLVIHMGFRIHYKLQYKNDRLLTLGFFLGCITYMVHGFFNNFLDTDKLAFPFWAFVAVLMVFDYKTAPSLNKP